MKKLMQAVREDRGFTLLELLLSFAILGILSVAVVMIIGASTTTYTGINNDVNLQYESQIALNQIQGYILDCNPYAAVTADGALYIFSKTGTAHYKVYKIYKDPAADTLLLAVNDGTLAAGTYTATDLASISFDATETLSSYVKGFSAVLTHVTGTKTIQYVTVTLQYGTGSKTYTGKQNITMRNAASDISVLVP